MDLSIIYKHLDQEKIEKISNYFMASNNPLYFGLIIKPSKGLWEYLKNNDELLVSFVDERNSYPFKIEYKIEVGENSIFFIKPAEEYEDKIKNEIA